MDDIAIKVEGVFKDFKIAHERSATLKAHFTSILKGKKNRTIETQHALKDISFEIKKGEFFGIVGRNGSGKSTMLKILAGIYQPTKGRTKVTGRLVPFIELGVGFNPELTGKENVYLNGALLGFSDKEIDELYEDIVDFAELENFMDQKLKNYSSGMQVRLAFSVATKANADVLLIDEVLAVGDMAFQRKCFDYFKQIKGSGTTVVFVTHDMNAIREYCDRALLIEDSKMAEIGDPDKIAQRYTKIFSKSSKKTNHDDDLRWGDGTIDIEKVSVTRNALKNEKELVFTVEVKANENIDDPVLGFLIRDAANQPIMGTNTKIKGAPKQPIKEGQKRKITWTIPNVFNDGSYYIEPSIVHGNMTEVSDWWGQAASFDVLKEDRTPYVVNPDVKYELDI